MRGSNGVPTKSPLQKRLVVHRRHPYWKRKSRESFSRWGSLLRNAPLYQISRFQCSTIARIILLSRFSSWCPSMKVELIKLAEEIEIIWKSALQKRRQTGEIPNRIQPWIFLKKRGELKLTQSTNHPPSTPQTFTSLTRASKIQTKTPRSQRFPLNIIMLEAVQGNAPV